MPKLVVLISKRPDESREVSIRYCKANFLLSDRVISWLVEEMGDVPLPA